MWVQVDSVKWVESCLSEFEHLTDLKWNCFSNIDILFVEFQKIYDRLNIKGLEEKGESFYHDLMKVVVEELKSDGES